MVDVPLNSWYIDTGAPINGISLLQGLERKWGPSLDEADLIIGKGGKVKVEWIETVNLKL